MVYISSDDVEPAIIELVSLCLLYVDVRMYPLQHSLGVKIEPRRVWCVLACVYTENGGNKSGQSGPFWAEGMDPG